MTAPRTPAIHSLEVLCPECGTTGTHRILHIRAFREGSSLSGTARCGACHATHPFEVGLAKCRVKTIVSEGSVSRTVALGFDPDRRLTTGERLEETERKYLISRIETPTSTSVRSALAKKVRVLWVLPGDLVRVKVSLTRGSHTVADVLALPPESTLRVGARIRLAAGPAVISGLRTHSHTLSYEGEEGLASEIVRVYARPVLLGYRRPPRSREFGESDDQPRFRRAGYEDRRRAKGPG